MTFERWLITKVTVILITIFSIFSIIIITNINTSLVKARESWLKAQIEQSSDQVINLLENSALTVKTMALNIEFIRNTSPDREYANKVVKAGLLSNNSLVGASTAWEPNAFDGRDSEFKSIDSAHDESGRLIPYWYRKLDGTAAVDKLVDYEKPGDGDWYLVPRQTLKQTIIDPYFYPIENKQVLMTTISQPIMDNGKFIGLTTVDISLDFLSDWISKQKVLETGKVFIVTTSGKVVAYPDVSANGKDIVNINLPSTIIEKLKTGTDSLTKINDKYFLIKSFKIANTSNIWYTVLEVPISEVRKEVTDTLFIIIGIAIISILIITISIIIIVRITILKPLGADPEEVIKRMNSLSQGKLLKKTNNFLKGSIAYAAVETENRIHDIVIDITDNISSTVNAVNEIASGNSDLSARTEAAAANLEQTAASTEELTQTIKQTTVATAKASSLAKEAVQVAKSSNESVEEAISSMDNIKKSSERIVDIISVIESIAFQTNILALNAAVEAARAGEQGRGFAVVATEVRALAKRSDTAAKEIKSLIEDTASVIDTGSDHVTKVGTLMSDIIDSIENVSTLITDINVSSNEQSNGITQINTAISQLDQMTQQNAALVEEISATAQSLKNQSVDLQKSISYFKIEN